MGRLGKPLRCALLGGLSGCPPQPKRRGTCPVSGVRVRAGWHGAQNLGDRGEWHPAPLGDQQPAAGPGAGVGGEVEGFGTGENWYPKAGGGGGGGVYLITFCFINT